MVSVTPSMRMMKKIKIFNLVQYFIVNKTRHFFFTAIKRVVSEKIISFRLCNKIERTMFMSISTIPNPKTVLPAC